MNKLAILAVSAAALAVPAMASAQVGNITAEATVNSVFSDGAVGNVEFPGVNPGETAAVNVDGSVGTPGFIEFGYNASYKITASTLPATLTDGTNTLPVSWECGTSNAVGSNPGSSAPCADGDVVHTNNTVTEAGTVVLWLGGSIDVPIGTLAGTYAENITFTISAF